MSKCTKCGAEKKIVGILAQAFAAHVPGSGVNCEQCLREYVQKTYHKSLEEMIDGSKQTQGQYCHYCGQRATGTGFFGEPVCSECGGR